MLAAQRRQIILERLRRSGAVRVSDLTSSLGVSDMTVRRDLETLQDAGLLAKVHGGATVVPAGERPPARANAPHREAIAALASGLLQPGAVVGIGAGGLGVLLAEQLRTVPDWSVLTNSVPIAEILLRKPLSGHTVALTGGTVVASGALTGPLAAKSLGGMQLDLAFLAVHGLDPENGLSAGDPAEGEVDRAFLGSARRLVVLAESSQWGRNGPVRFARLDQADVVVCDQGLSGEARAALRAAGIDLRLTVP